MADDPSYVYGQGPGNKRARRLLLGLVVVEQKGYHDLAYRPNWPRLAWVIPVTALAAWLLGSEAYYFKERYMGGITTTRRGDMYLYFPDSIGNWFANLPLTKEEVRRRERALMLKSREEYGRIAHLQHKGEYFVTVAKAALVRQDYAEFSKYIGTGANLAPKNLEAQRLCADLFFAFGRPLDAYQILEESLEFSLDDQTHFRSFLYRGFMLDQDQRIIDCAKKYLPMAGLNAGIKSDLQIAQAQANFLRGNYTETSRLIQAYQLDQTPEGFLLKCQVLWETNERAEALKLLDAATSAYPGVTRLLELKAKWLKDNGNLAGARDCLDLLFIKDPSNPGPTIQSLFLIPGPENAAKREGIIDKLLREHGRNDRAMLELAQYANDSIQPALTGRLLKWSEERRFPNRLKFALTHVECLINSQQPHAAVLLVEELIRQSDREQWMSETRIAFDALRTIGYFADGQPEIGLINLQRLMQNKNVPPQLLVASGRKLIAAKRFVEANNMLIAAHLQNETNQSILLQIVQLKLAHPQIASDLETYLRRLMATRKPPRDILESALRSVGSDTFRFSGDREQLLTDLEKLLN